MAGDFGDDSGGGGYSETSSESWFSRMMDSIKGVLIGLVLFVVAPALIYWNEKRAVDRITVIGSAEKDTIDVNADKPDSANEGKLVYLTGKAVPVGTVSDPLFGISAEAIKLIRKVEMYQWKEEKESKKHKKLGGGTETKTTYTYDKIWSEGAINSKDFKQSGHENPAMPLKSETFPAKTVKVGGFELGSSLVHKIGGESKLPFTKKMADKLSKDVTDKFGNKPIKAVGEGLYVGNDPGSPTIGDVRINFEEIKPTDVSVIAKQTGEKLGPYSYPTGAFEDLRMGTMSRPEIFKANLDENATLTWILRLVGFIVWAVGIYLIFAPLETMADVIPFVGDLIGIGLSIFAALSAAVLSLITIGICWLVVRPLLGGSILGVALLLFIGMYMMRKPAKG